MKVLFCKDCGIELDAKDVETNVLIFGVFKLLCWACAEADGEELGLIVVKDTSVRTVTLRPEIWSVL